MMNDESEQFAQRLSRQPLRQVPREWRGEILSAAHAAQTTCHPPPATRHLKPSPPSSTLHFLSSLLWPHPKAWAGLAAVWFFIFAVNFSTREPSPKMAGKSAPPSPEMLVELRKQQRLLAELAGPREPQDADRPRIFVPRPRGERTEILMT